MKRRPPLIGCRCGVSPVRSRCGPNSFSTRSRFCLTVVLRSSPQVVAGRRPMALSMHMEALQPRRRPPPWCHTAVAHRGSHRRGAGKTAPIDLVTARPPIWRLSPSQEFAMPASRLSLPSAMACSSHSAHVRGVARHLGLLAGPPSSRIPAISRIPRIP